MSLRLNATTRVGAYRFSQQPQCAAQYDKTQARCTNPSAAKCWGRLPDGRADDLLYCMEHVRNVTVSGLIEKTIRQDCFDRHLADPAHYDAVILTDDRGGW